MSQAASELLTTQEGVQETQIRSEPQGSLTDLRDLQRSSSKKKKRLRIVLVILALAVACAALRLTVFVPKPLFVEVVRVEKGTVEQTVSNTRAGTVKARRRARLSPENGGRVVELPHRAGSLVKKGDLLLRLDDSLQQAQLELTREDIRVATARSEEACLGAELAQTELERAITLGENGITSNQIVDARRSERDRSRAGCSAARAVLDQARARERLAQAELARTELHAPFDGVIADMSTELGEWITPSPPGVPLPPIMDLIDRSSIYVDAPIDEMDAERVSEGQTVRISVDSRRDEHFPGRLVRVASYVLDVVEQNRTVEIEAELDDPAVAESFLPGTSADIEVILSRREDVLQIPTGAIGPEDKVLVVVEGRLVERVVVTGLRNWRTTEIKEGLREGESVVISRDTPDIVAGAAVVVEEES